MATLLVFIMATLETVFGQIIKLLDAKAPFDDNVVKAPARSSKKRKLSYMQLI